MGYAVLGETELALGGGGQSGRLWGRCGGADAFSQQERKFINTTSTSPCMPGLVSCSIGGWRGEGNREIILYRACVRACVPACARSGCQLRSGPEIRLCALSLCPFVAGGFPFSLVGYSETR